MNSPAELMGAADRAIAERDPSRALAALAQARAAGDNGAELHMKRALALRMRGAFAEAVEALDHALAREPYNFLAHLSKGALLERLDRPREAARAYRVAVDLAPPADRLPPSLVQPLARAREAALKQSDALATHLRAAVAPLRPRDQNLDRFDRALAIYSGTEAPPESEGGRQPILLHYPDLPITPFPDRALFPWLSELEAATPTVQHEFDAVRDLGGEAWEPYIAYPPGAPVNQWGELNHSRRWSTLFLWKDGERHDAVCAACPQTSALLERLPIARQPGFAPTAMFSALEPRTRIPPHTGSANTRLIVHLPLVLPGPARFRVGAQIRDWRLGEAWVFDDTIEHEAWNDADETRVILIFDIWHPLLTPTEIALVSRMMTAKNAWMAEEA